MTVPPFSVKSTCQSLYRVKKDDFVRKWIKSSRSCSLLRKIRYVHQSPKVTEGSGMYERKIQKKCHRSLEKRGYF